MQGFWEGMGIRTTMNTRVTLADLRRMDRYDLCILSAHGAYYTYSYGALWKRTRTEPIILLTEESTFYKDIVYSFELLSHRVIKMNGLYCATADFFRNAYRAGQLSSTIVYSETCEFLGVTGSVDESMAEALLAGGARAVLGYVNNLRRERHHLVHRAGRPPPPRRSGLSGALRRPERPPERASQLLGGPACGRDHCGRHPRRSSGSCRLSVALLMKIVYTKGWQ